MKVRLALPLCLAALATASVAGAQAPEPSGGEVAAPAHTITNPDWRTRPTGAALARFYPARAQLMEMDGAATISCTVTSAGRLAPCHVVSEAPQGYGFGDAALKLAPIFSMMPKTVDGLGVDGGTVRIPISFRVPRDEREQAEPEPQWRRITFTVLASIVGIGGVALKLLQLFPNLGRPRRRSRSEPAA